MTNWASSSNRSVFSAETRPIPVVLPVFFPLKARLNRRHPSRGQSVVWQELRLGALQRRLGPDVTADFSSHVDARQLLPNHRGLRSLGAKGVDKLRTQVCIGNGKSRGLVLQRDYLSVFWSSYCSKRVLLPFFHSCLCVWLVFSSLCLNIFVDCFLFDGYAQSCFDSWKTHNL